MPDPVLTLLKYVFLAILYLFFMRVLRAVWLETREPKPAPLPPVPAGGGPHPGGPNAAVAGAAPAGSGIPGTNGAVGPEKLVVVAPEAMVGQEFPIGGEATVGRAGGCAVMLSADTFVSQLHARLFRREKDIFVEDLGSTNGTFLNGKKVSAPVTIRKGDKIQFGRTTLEVRK